MKGRTRRAFLTADHCGPERSGWHENMHKKRAPGRMNGPTCGTSAFGAIHATGESSRAAVGEMEFRFYVQAFSVRCASLWQRSPDRRTEPATKDSLDSGVSFYGAALPAVPLIAHHGTGNSHQACAR